MSSVTQRIKEIKQPYGGYLKPSEFERIELTDEIKLNDNENINAGLVGLAVDYLTRYQMGTDLEEAFKFSLMGAKIINELPYAEKLLNNIKGLDNNSISNACKLVGYDVCYRSNPLAYRPVNDINPDEDTIKNIKIMVNRGIRFFKEYGPVIKDGFTFEGGYTNTINTGDGDFLTNDTLWDFKVSVNKPTASNTLQLLIYYIMGKHSIHNEFDNIKYIAIFNPRLNCIYRKAIKDIPNETIKEVERNVIGYYNFKSDYNYNTSNLGNQGILYMPEIMRYLNCSRHMVMKYYTQDGLPLFKEKNRYCICIQDLFQWKEKKKEKDRKNQIFAFSISIAFCAIAIILIAFIFEKTKI